MIKKRVPINIWGYGVQWTTQVIQRTFTQAYWLLEDCPLQDVTGNITDISEYLDFGFYNHVSYKYNSILGITGIRSWIGVSHRFGRLISYLILTQNGTVISITTVQSMISPKTETDEIKTSVNKSLQRGRILDLWLIQAKSWKLVRVPQIRLRLLGIILQYDQRLKCARLYHTRWIWWHIFQHGVGYTKIWRWTWLY